MDKIDKILLILAVVLVIGMLLTAIFGRGSRHGYGMIFYLEKPAYGRVFAV